MTDQSQGPSDSTPHTLQERTKKEGWDQDDLLMVCMGFLTADEVSAKLASMSTEEQADYLAESARKRMVAEHFQHEFEQGATSDELHWYQLLAQGTPREEIREALCLTPDQLRELEAGIASHGSKASTSLPDLLRAPWRKE